MWNKEKSGGERGESSNIPHLFPKEGNDKFQVTREKLVFVSCLRRTKRKKKRGKKK